MSNVHIQVTMASAEKLPDMLHAACREGDLATVKAIAGLVPPFDRHLAMAWACRRGRLDAVETVIRYGDVDVARFLQTFRCAFWQAAGVDGHMHVAQWLLDAGLTPSPEDWNKAFTAASIQGFLACAQWVLCHGHGAVDVHSLCDKPFRRAAEKGRLHMAKWLLSLGHVHIHAHDNAAMARAAGNGHMDFCRWLLGLDQDDAAWPQDVLQALRFWSPARDVWMRSVLHN
jgi:hypothetical protein